MARLLLNAHTLRQRLLLAMLLLVVLLGSIVPARVTAQSPALATARLLEHNGEWEAAEQAYRGLLDDRGETGEIARLELARRAEQSDRYDEALALLQPLVDQSSGSVRTARAWLQYGSVLQALGRAAEAVRAYARYIELDGPAAPYARVETAKLSAQARGHGALLETLDPLLRGGGPEHARRVALRLAAPAAEDAGRSTAALDYYRQLTVFGATSGERAMALWKVAALERASGNQAEALTVYRTLVTRFPERREAEDAVAALAQLGRPASAIEAGLVAYRRGHNADARDLFNRVLAGSPSAAEMGIALLYLGALAERRGELALAAENYTESVDADPNGRLAAEALWWAALALDEAENETGAQPRYAALVERFPAHPRAPEAAFRNGDISFRAGRAADARARWGVALRSSVAGVAATGGFWLGVAQAEAGDRAAATATWTEAVRRDPAGYYGLRAAAQLAGKPLEPRHGSASLTVTPSDWAAAESWLASWAGPEDVRAWSTFEPSDEWRAIIAIAEAGWTRTVTDAFTVAINRRTDKPWLLYRIGRTLADAGYADLGMAAARQILARVPDGPAAAPAPARAIQRLAYPIPWLDLVQRQADQYGVDPLLVYAMMRQESAFNPTAGSSAGAYGLTQVIPGTAAEIAAALRHESFSFADLARPVVAIEFGVFYLGAQVKDQSSNVYRGLAAYNGGGSSAYRWVRSAGNTTDIDRFQEAIDYSETELYVRIVIENYAWYRYLYGAAERPSVVR